MTTDERWADLAESLGNSHVCDNPLACDCWVGHATTLVTSLRTDHELLIEALERIDALPFSDKVYGIHDIARTALDRIATPPLEREEE